jgi:hypothetical protein
LGGIPSHYSVDLDLVSPVDLTGIPTGYQIDIKSLPRIEVGLDPITINPVTVNPLDVSVRLKEIPSVRTHVPAAFTVGFSLFGLQLATIRLCGEAQVITEPYVPNPCEHCGAVLTIPAPLPQPPGTVTPGATVPARKAK